ADANLADIDRTEISINDLKPPATTNRTRQTSVRDRLKAQFSSGLFRNHRHARTSIKYEAKIILRAVDSNFDNRAIIAVLEFVHGSIRAVKIGARTYTYPVSRPVD